MQFRRRDGLRGTHPGNRQRVASHHPAPALGGRCAQPDRKRSLGSVCQGTRPARARVARRSVSRSPIDDRPAGAGSSEGPLPEIPGPSVTNLTVARLVLIAVKNHHRIQGRNLILVAFFGKRSPFSSHLCARARSSRSLSRARLGTSEEGASPP